MIIMMMDDDVYVCVVLLFVGLGGVPSIYQVPDDQMGYRADEYAGLP